MLWAMWDNTQPVCFQLLMSDTTEGSDVWDSLWFQAADNNHWNYTFKVGWDVVGYVGQYTAPVVLIPLRGQSSFLFLILWMDVVLIDNTEGFFKQPVCYLFAFSSCCVDTTEGSVFFPIPDSVDGCMRQLMISSCRNYTFKVGWDVVGYVGQYTTCLPAPVVLIPLRGQSSFLFLILWMDVWDSLWFQAADNNHWNYTFKVGWDVVGYVGQYTTCLLSAPVVLIPLRGQSSFLFLILWMDVWDSLWFKLQITTTETILLK